MDPSTLIEAYGSLGVTGVMALLFGFMITNIIKSQASQDGELEAIRENASAMSEVMSNTQSIVLKLVDRIQRESEQQSDERNRRHEAISRDIADMDAQISEIKGIISRLNGRH
jgi:hypothetical protein